MRLRLFYKNFFLILGIDVLLLLCSLYSAYLMRFDFDSPIHFFHLFNRVVPIILMIKLVSFFYFDLYRGMWRYMSIADLMNIIKAATLSTMIIISFILYSHRFEGFSRSVFAIDWSLTILLIAGFRLCVRFYFEKVNEDLIRHLFVSLVDRIRHKHKDDLKRLLIVGAGDCGEKIYREIRNNAQLRYRVVGFLDDHPVKVGKKIHGIPVLNHIGNVKAAVKKVRADEALIAIPSAKAEQMRRIVAHLKESGIKFNLVPGMGELINGTVTTKAIRKVAYRDLLGRDVTKLDTQKIGAYLKGQTVMVTGAGGSIGSELSRQIARFHPKRIILFEIAETPLYEIDMELNDNFKKIEIVPTLGNIQVGSQVESIFARYRPGAVFHAAAYKHVPMLESQPWKAVENNILGTLTLIEAAKKYQAERFVFVSTDKAVRPANIMGASKRIAEILIQNQGRSPELSTRFITVRFGNVVGSAGSVVPLFKKQIEKGGPVTVTHPEVTRYFMTIYEASQLILQAGAMGNGGEIYVLDMGTPVKIVNMARDLIRLSGFEPDVDIQIEYMGLRPGEKLYEELITEGEDVLPTTHEKIMVLKGMSQNLQQLNGNLDLLAKYVAKQDQNGIREGFRAILPEYCPADRV